MTDNTKPTKKIEKQKRMFRCVGIDRKNLPMPKYAAAIEEELNALHGDGYDVRVFDLQTKSVFIMGKVAEENRGIMVPVGAIPLPSHDTGPNINFKNQHTPGVLNQVLNMASRGPAEKMKEAMEALSDQVLEAMPVAEASTIIEDLENIATEHEKTDGHKSEEGCKAPEAMREFTKALRGKIQLRLQ